MPLSMAQKEPILQNVSHVWKTHGGLGPVESQHGLDRQEDNLSKEIDTRLQAGHTQRDKPQKTD